MPPKNTSKTVKTSKTASKTPGKTPGKTQGKTSGKPAPTPAKNAKTAKVPEGNAEGETSAADPAAPPTHTVGVKQISAVLLDDVNNEIKTSGMYPLVIDANNTVSTFLRYRDVNYLNAQNPGDMDPTRIRLAILGGLRYGKPAVLDLADTDMVDNVTEKFDKVKQDLLELIITKQITQEDIYKTLITEGDDPAYSSWFEYQTESFNFIVVAINDTACQALKHRFYNIVIE